MTTETSFFSPLRSYSTCVSHFSLPPPPPPLCISLVKLHARRTKGKISILSHRAENEPDTCACALLCKALENSRSPCACFLLTTSKRTGTVTLDEQTLSRQKSDEGDVCPTSRCVLPPPTRVQFVSVFDARGKPVRLSTVSNNTTCSRARDSKKFVSKGHRGQ